jgi:hypothetical protein
LGDETPAQWQEQAFNFCKALLKKFSVKEGTPIFDNKSISNGAQYGTLDSKIKCLSLAIFFGGNPTNKTETASTWVTTNSKPLGPIIMMDQLEILSLSHVQFITLVFGDAQLCCALYQPR